MDYETLYNNLTGTIETKFNKGNPPQRNRFFFIESRFKIEYGNAYNEMFIKFLINNILIKDASQLMDIINNGNLEIINNVLTNDTAINNFFQNNRNDDVNDYWQGNSNEYINEISNYNENGMLNNVQAGMLSSMVVNINNDPLRYIYEIIQNADDCCAKNFKLEILEDNKVVITYEESGMTCYDVFAISVIGETGKRDRSKRIIGEKGVGFKTIFASCKAVNIYSGGYSFRQYKDKDNTLKIEPITKNKYKPQITRLELELENKINSNELYNELKEKYGLNTLNTEKNKERAFKNCPVLFTNSLKSIEIILNKNSSFNIACSKNEEDIKICIGLKENEEHTTNLEIDCFKKSFDVCLNWEAYSQRYPNQFNNEEEFDNADDAITIYPIVIVAPKNPTNDNITTGNVYSYLPTSTEIHAPLAIQLPIKLNLDRSGMFFEGDTDSTGVEVDLGKLNTFKWNIDIMERFIDTALPVFYNYLKENSTSIFNYLPNYTKQNPTFFNEKNNNDNVHNMNSVFSEDIFNFFKEFPYFNDGKKCYEVVMYDKFISEKFGVDFHSNYLKDPNSKTYICYNEYISKKLGVLEIFKFTYSEKPNNKYTDDDKLSELINKLLGNNTDLKDEIRNLYCVDVDLSDSIIKQLKQLPSNFLPKEPSKLCVFPVRRSEEHIEYIKHCDGIWFVNEDKELYSKKIICFTDISLKDLKLDYVEINTVENTNDIMSVFNKVSKKYLDLNPNIIESEIIIELMSFIVKYLINDSDLNWYSYTKEILEKDLSGNQLENFRNDEVYNLAKLVSQVEPTQENNNFMKIYTLKVLSHGILSNSKNCLSLPLPPISNWNEDFCKALNFLEYSNNFSFSLNDTLQDLEDENIKNEFSEDTLGKTIPEVNSILFYDNLPTNFVRFSGTVILNSDDEIIINNCKNSMKKGLGLVKVFKNKLLAMSTPKDVNLENLDLLTKMIILNIDSNIDGSISREDLEYDVINELLQNANDKVSDGIINIDVNEDSITLSYNEKKGFLVKDFIAVSTLRNSGNEDLNSIGYKGTGFKGVYKYFQKVIIQSNGVKCVLDDTQTFDEHNICFNKGATDIDLEKQEYIHKKQGDQDPFDHYPIPIFSDDNHNPFEAENKLTTITLTFKTDIDKDSIKNTFIDLRDSNKFYFLDNITKFYIHGDGKETGFDREKYCEENFYKYVHEAQSSNIKKLLIDNNIERYKNKEIPDEHCYVTVLFPKNIPTDNINIPNLFVGLPVEQNNEFSGKFYVNAPFLQLQDNRLNLSKSDDLKADSTTFKLYKLYKLYIPVAILEAISSLDKSIAYKYFPYEKIKYWSVYYDDPDNNPYKIPFIKTIQFIRTVTNTSATNTEKFISINDLESVDLLPNFVYNKIKNGKVPYSQEKPFIYYDNDDEFYDIISSGTNKQPVNDLTLFYKWALGEDCKETVHKIEGLENYQLEIPHIDDIFKNKINTFFENHTIVDCFYYNCFENIRSEVYFYENKLIEKPNEDPILKHLKDIKNYSYLHTKFLNEMISKNIDNSLIELIKSKYIESRDESGYIIVKTTKGDYNVLNKNMYYTESVEHWLKVDYVFSTSNNSNSIVIKNIIENLDTKHVWNEKFFCYLESYNKYILDNTNNTIPNYSFKFDDMTTKIHYDIISRCESNIPNEYLNKPYCLNKSKTMLELLNNDIMILSDTDGHKQQWTFGYVNGEPKLIIFGERSLQKLMKEFFGYEGFTLSKEYTKIEWEHPDPDYEQWNTFKVLKDTKFEIDKDQNIKEMLVNKFELELKFNDDDNKFYIFKGYGLKCPICKNELMAQMSQFRTILVKITQDIWVTIVLCITCRDTIAYTNQVYFCNENESIFTKEQIMYIINNDKDDITLKICFEMTDGEKKYHTINITPLHRKIIKNEIEK